MALSLILADDKPAIAKIISLSLPREEFIVQSVTTGKAVLELIEKQIPHFLLIDISLPFQSDGQFPQKDGFFITRHIKTHPSLKRIKTILLTNAFEPVDDATCREYQADGVLVKPFDPSELRSKLKSLITPDLQQESSQLKINVPEPHLPDSAPIHAAPAIDANHSDGEELSANAIELADFFAKEIAANSPQTPTETIAKNSKPAAKRASQPRRATAAVANDAIELDMTDISLAANEWKPVHPSLEENLAQWQQKAAHSGPASDIFDLGGSTFEFHPDYLNRVGSGPGPLHIVESPSKTNLSASEAVVIRAHSATTPVQSIPTPQTPTPARPALDTAEIEALVREETRRTCQEIVDKVAWEVIPELAENIIRRELDKVLKALETDPQ